jgi:hypothetical protein
MATHADIAQVTVGQGGPTVAYTAAEMVITVVDALAIGMVGVPIPEPVEVLEVVTPGIQGPMGLQNTFISQTAPPLEDRIPYQTIWFKIP